MGKEGRGKDGRDRQGEREGRELKQKHASVNSCLCLWSLPSTITINRHRRHLHHHNHHHHNPVTLVPVLVPEKVLSEKAGIKGTLLGTVKAKTMRYAYFGHIMRSNGAAWRKRDHTRYITRKKNNRKTRNLMDGQH